jgi:methionyl-tRNA synthetase
MTTPAPTPTPAPAAAPAAAAASDALPNIAYDLFAKLDLRVATVMKAEPHPNADKLLKLTLDDGTPNGRQVCAGIKQYYDPASLVGRQIILVANLAPRVIRGETSNGMLLAASAREGEVVQDVVLLAPSKPVPAGSTVG